MSFIGIPNQVVDNQNVTISERDIEVSQLQERFRTRQKFFKQNIGDNPEVDKAKPMMMVGSGSDISVFLGSEISKGYYIDPIYRYSHANAGIKIGDDIYDSEYDDLLEQLKITEGVTDIVETPNYVGDDILGLELVSSTITFGLNGNPRELNIISTDNLNFIPEEIKQNGCSLYVAIGVGSNLILPRVKSDFYAVSVLCPEALGYSKIIAQSKDFGRIAIAKKFNELDLSPAEVNIIHSLSIDMISDYLRYLEYDLDLEATKSRAIIARSLFPDKQQEYLAKSANEFFNDVVEKFFVSLEDLNYQLRKKVVITIENELESLFPNTDNANELFKSNLNILKSHLLSLRMNVDE